MFENFVQLRRGDEMSEKQDGEKPEQEPVKRRPGRPPTYIFSKPDSELSENERRLKGSVIKRRLRQNRSYHRKKQLKELEKQAGKPPPHNARPPPGQAPAFAHPAYRHANPPPSAPLSLSSMSSAALPVSLPPLASQPTRPVLQTTEHVFRSFPFFADDAPAPAFQTSASMQTNSVCSNVTDIPPLSTEEIIATVDKTLESSTNVKTDPASRVLTPRVDGSIMHNPASNVQVRVENSGGIPFLSVGATGSPPAPGKHVNSGYDESDEAQLLDDILTVGSNDRTDSVVEEHGGTGLRRLLKQGLDNRLAALPRGVMEALKHLALFATSFDATAAMVVMGTAPHPDEERNAATLQPLVGFNLIRRLPSGRFELIDKAKSFISNESFDGASAARQRFVLHYSEKLRQLDMNTLYRNAQKRLSAMRVYDVERQNVDVALQMCRDMRDMQLLTTFLANGATVMRYSVPAKQRLDIYGPVLKELRPPHQQRQLCGVEQQARMLLALAEAYFDLFMFEKAEFTLRKVFGLMAASGCVTFPLPVLALLLLAELRISALDFDEGNKLLVQALKTLTEWRFERSTFTVCINLNLASIAIAKGDADGGMQYVNKALSLLGDLGFKDMPIYVDALGTLGSVCMRKGEYSEGLTYFVSGLRLIQDWMQQKEWQRAPFQHCTHLDIFLAEAIGTAKKALEHSEDPGEFARAMQQREERGLPGRGLATWECQVGRAENGARMHTRHLY
eukprot:GFKZ01007172.1.p1 GENE.GFKZ01007172.1~~GFKZ01007172.1.p1  ORF type:complete len:733 (+),score=95.60 GFKZ01007172.1:261-2459(+)